MPKLPTTLEKVAERVIELLDQRESDRKQVERTRR